MTRIARTEESSIRAEMSKVKSQLSDFRAVGSNKTSELIGPNNSRLDLLRGWLIQIDNVFNTCKDFADELNSRISHYSASGVSVNEGKIIVALVGYVDFFLNVSVF